MRPVWWTMMNHDWPSTIKHESLADLVVNPWFHVSLKNKKMRDEAAVNKWFLFHIATETGLFIDNKHEKSWCSYLQWLVVYTLIMVHAHDFPSIPTLDDQRACKGCRQVARIHGSWLGPLLCDGEAAVSGMVDYLGMVDDGLYLFISYPHECSHHCPIYDHHVYINHH